MTTRPPRTDVEGTAHHVMNRASRSWPVFFDEQDRRAFCRAISEGADHYRVDVLAYALMSTHFHLVVFHGEAEMAPFMRYVQSRYARLFNVRHGYSGPLFRARYASRLIVDDADLVNVCRYVHRNVLDVPADPRSHAWSSLRAFISGDLPAWLDTRGIDAAGSVDDHVADVMADRASDETLADLVPQEAFIALDPGHRADVDLLQHIERKFHGVDDSPAVRARSRRVALVMAADVDLPRSVVAKMLGYGSPTALANATSRARRALAAGGK